MTAASQHLSFLLAAQLHETLPVLLSVISLLHFKPTFISGSPVSSPRTQPGFLPRLCTYCHQNRNRSFEITGQLLLLSGSLFWAPGRVPASKQCSVLINTLMHSMSLINTLMHSRTSLCQLLKRYLPPI